MSAVWVARGVLVGTWILLALLHLTQSPERRVQVWPLSYMLLEVLATASLAYRAWRTEGAERPAWTLLAVASFLEIPNLLVTFLSGGRHLPAASSVVSLLSAATGILGLAGVLSFPKEAEQAKAFRRRALDGLLFAGAVLFLLWMMGVQGSLRASVQGMGLRVMAAYLNAALLGGGLIFMVSGRAGRTIAPLRWLGGSALAWLASLSCWTLAGLPPVPAAAGWIVVAGGIPLFQGLAAWSWVENPRPVERKVEDLFPYLPIVVAMGVLGVLLPGASMELLRGAFGIFLAIVALLLLRQLQAIRDLRAARATLEDRVRQRTEALEEAQEALLRTERLNTLALMGAGLAHDLNNLLSVMKSAAEMAVLNLESGRPPALADLSRITVTAERAADLTGRLMRFVRREAEEVAPTDLTWELRDMETTLRMILPRTVELLIEVPAEEALVVLSSRPRLEQMLVNLVANARDAMPAGGRLTIRAAPAPERDVAKIDVADSGTGMTPEVLERIFDPFFTTKPLGKGTGLGLPSLRALVEEGGGRLEVASEPGKGSRFSIFLPLMSSAEGLMLERA
ncbi:sensor histidine kinase [Geothrix sp. 21YS21S-4]|uniref:sensor histidine kinase n=1 Tax=Geothrix sp. 21YS21S-4 TaxID=3068889 RepID=UPI0027B8E7B7|nr:ATP-binding protein [Geothrix sp. 21YS21S-4]